MTGIYSDAQLAAFLNGTLDDAEAAQIEQAINNDPVLAKRAETLALADDGSADTAHLVRDAFAPVLGADVPDHLTAIVGGPQSAEIVDFAASRAQRHASFAANDGGADSPRAAWHWPQFAAMAASLVVGVMIGGPLLTGGDGSGSGSGDGAMVLASADGVNAAPAIAAMLDTAPSGQAVDLGGLGQGEVVLTFRNLDGQLCRQFMLEGAGGTNDAVACAHNSGDGWQVEAMGRRAEPIGEMRLAGGDAAVGVVAAVDEMIDSDPIVGSDEQAALERR
ncbi:hypothetical protein [Qipengyuania sp. ASV99]|uniref:hypothetical protein n=1 Tax=Qipengyuania sp. ASV99 TaxID=3399681 RepID=UPI003A4C6E1E